MGYWHPVSVPKTTLLTTVLNYLYITLMSIIACTYVVHCEAYPDVVKRTEI